MSKPKPKITYYLRDGRVEVDGIVYRSDPRFHYCLLECEHRNNACPDNFIVCPHIYLRFSIKPPDSVFCSDKTVWQTIENIKNQKAEKPYMSNAWMFGSTPDTLAAKNANIKAAKAAKSAKLKTAREAVDAKVKATLKAYNKKCKELKAAKDQQRLDEISSDIEAGRYSISPSGELFVDSDPGKLITEAEYAKDKFEEPENTYPHKIDYESSIGSNNSDVDMEESYRDWDGSEKPLYNRDYKRLTKAKEDELLAVRKFNKNTQLYSFPKTKKGRSNQEKLFKANIWAIRAVAKKYMYNSAGLKFEDLFAAGTIGFTQAMQRYDPTKETRLSTYAWWYVAKTVNEAIGKETKNFCQPKKVQDIYKSLKREIELWYKLKGNNPTEDEIVDRVAQLLPKEKKPTIRQVYRVYVVDYIPPVGREPLDDEPEYFIDTDSDQEEDLTTVKSYGDSEIQTGSLDESDTGIFAEEEEDKFIDYRTPSAEYCSALSESWSKFLWIVRNKLDPKLGDILKMRHGAMNGDNREYNFTKIGKHYGCNKSTAWRLYQKAIETVREAWDNF